MSELLNGELPIGFGLGKTPEYWKNVVLTAANHKQAMANFLPDYSCNNDPDIMTICEAAALLRCSIDRVRRIPRSELPARAGPGRLLLYLRVDILNYVRSMPGTEKRGSGMGAIEVLEPGKLSYKEFDIDAAKSILAEN